MPVVVAATTRHDQCQQDNIQSASQHSANRVAESANLPKRMQLLTASGCGSTIFHPLMRPNFSETSFKKSLIRHWIPCSIVTFNDAWNKVLTRSLVTSSLDRVLFSFPSYSWYNLQWPRDWRYLWSLCITLQEMRCLDHHYWPLSESFLLPILRFLSIRNIQQKWNETKLMNLWLLMTCLEHFYLHNAFSHLKVVEYLVNYLLWLQTSLFPLGISMTWTVTCIHNQQQEFTWFLLASK